MLFRRLWEFIADRRVRDGVETDVVRLAGERRKVSTAPPAPRVIRLYAGYFVVGTFAHY
jgi:hypothetical protein